MMRTTMMRPFAVVGVFCVASSFAGEYEAGVALYPRVAVDASGRFVLAWNARTNVLVQRYDAAGIPVGDVLTVSADGQPNPEREILDHSVARDDGGDFAVAWESSAAGDERQVGLRYFDADGNQTAEFAELLAVRPDVSMAANGTAVLSYFSFLNNQVTARLFPSEGTPAGPALPLNALGTRPWESVAAANDAGSFAVAYEESRRRNDVFLSLYLDPATVVLSESINSNEARDPGIAMDARGNVAVVWEERLFLGSFPSFVQLADVKLAVFDMDGSPILGPLLVNTGHFSQDPDPTVAMDENGHVVVTYSAFQDGVLAILAKRYSLGSAFEPRDALWVSEGIAQARPHKNASVAMTNAGPYVVAWESFKVAPDGEFESAEIHFRVFDDPDDSDQDGVDDASDNCPDLFNPLQLDGDGDTSGDACDPDVDGDALLNADDNCPFVTNADQLDGDGDGVGDVCDNCPIMMNASQEDADYDGTGDACDPCPEGGGCEPFIRGNANGDGAVDVSDAVVVAGFLFLGDSVECVDATDTNDNGVVNITDVIFLVNHLFRGGPGLPPPYPDEGADLSQDQLDCRNSTFPGLPQQVPLQ